MYTKPLPSAERLNYLLSYNPNTGHLRWKKPQSSNCAKGIICPGIGNHGYKMVGVDGQSYFQHRVIWVMMTGSPPPDGLVIDHIDERPGNNRWDNLRVITNRENIIRSNKLNRMRVRAIRLPSGNWRAIRDAVNCGTYTTKEAALILDQSRRTELSRMREGEPVVRVIRTRNSTWAARVNIDGKRIHLGTFPTKEQALAAEIPEQRVKCTPL